MVNKKKEKMLYKIVNEQECNSFTETDCKISQNSEKEISLQNSTSLNCRENSDSGNNAINKFCYLNGSSYFVNAAELRKFEYLLTISTKTKDKQILEESNKDEINGSRSRKSNYDSLSHENSNEASQNSIDLNSSSNTNSDADEIKHDSTKKSSKKKTLNKAEKTRSKQNKNKNFQQLTMQKIWSFNDFYIFNIDEVKLKNYLLSSLTTYINESESKIYCLICHNFIENTFVYIYEHWRSKKHALELNKLNEITYWNLPGNINIKEINLPLNFIEAKMNNIVEQMNFFCYACNTTVFQSGSKKIDYVCYNLHIKSPTHVLQKSIVQRRCNKLHNSILWCHTGNILNIDFYQCIPCKSKFTNETSFASHLKSKRHLEKIKIQKDIIQFDGCTACGMWWLGSIDLYDNHCNSKHKINELYNIFNVPNDMTEFIIKYFKQPDMPEIFNEKNEVDIIIQSLEKTAKQTFPEAKAYAFGSRETGLALPNSDVDIFLDCGNAYRNGLNLKKLLTYMNKIWILLKRSNEWILMRKLEHSRIPILTVKHKSTNIICDISFSSGLGIENTKLIRCYMRAFPMLKKLILFMKNWLQICDLYGSQIIKTYAISWFVIFYLQSMKILPSVAQLIEWKNQSHTVCGWETGICENIPVIQSNFTLRELLTGMLVFYSEFNYLYNVACPLTGEIIPKINFVHIEYLPHCMNNYKEYIKMSFDPECFRIDSIMCIQDPFDLSHNLTKAVKKFNLFMFQYLCMKTVEILIELDL